MISEKSASKKYRFPFDIAAEGPPRTPTMSSTYPVHNGGGSNTPNMTGAKPGFSIPTTSEPAPPVGITPLIMPINEDDDVRDVVDVENNNTPRVHTPNMNTQNSNSETYDDAMSSSSNDDAMSSGDDEDEDGIQYTNDYDNEPQPTEK
eukprot:324725_1